MQATLTRPAPRANLYAALERIAGQSAPSRHAIAPPEIAEAAKAPDPEAELIDVLLAEDNKTNQLVFSKMLSDLPIRLRIAENGQEALDQIAASRPDLVFMDISMPGMDGKEATRRLRAEEDRSGAPRLPVIAVTAHAMSEDRKATMASGLDDYITKPVRKAAIRAAIEAALPGRITSDA